MGVDSSLFRPQRMYNGIRRWLRLVSSAPKCASQPLRAVRHRGAGGARYANESNAWRRLMPMRRPSRVASSWCAPMPGQPRPGIVPRARRLRRNHWQPVTRRLFDLCDELYGLVRGARREPVAAPASFSTLGDRLGNKNRREFFGLFAGALLPTAVRATTTVDTSRERRYRADAQVLLLSIPILRRSGVGGGSVVWREWREVAGLVRLLEFNGYSLPEKAAGLNRFGFIREKSCRDERGIREARYFGVMTASPEESVEEAHRALQSTATEAVYTAIQGRMADREIETASTHFNGPARLSPERRDELLARAQQALSVAPKKAPEFHASGAIRCHFCTR